MPDHMKLTKTPGDYFGHVQGRAQVTSPNMDHQQRKHLNLKNRTGDEERRIHAHTAANDEMWRRQALYESEIGMSTDNRRFSTDRDRAAGISEAEAMWEAAGGGKVKDSTFYGRSPAVDNVPSCYKPKEAKERDDRRSLGKLSLPMPLPPMHEGAHRRVEDGVLDHRVPIKKLGSFEATNGACALSYPPSYISDRCAILCIAYPMSSAFHLIQEADPEPSLNHQPKLTSPDSMQQVKAKMLLAALVTCLS